MHALSQRVTENKVGATPFATNHHLPSLTLGVSSSDALEPVDGVSRRCCGAALSKQRRCSVRSPLPPTTVSSALAFLLVTTILTRRALPPVRSAGHGNPPMRRLSMGPPPSHSSSSSNNTNTVPLPPTPPITLPSVIPFVTPQQPHPLRRLQNRTPIYWNRGRYDEW